MKRIKMTVVFLAAFGLLSSGLNLVGVATAGSQTKCPVMGGRINQNVYTDYDGKRIYFCCPGCINAFKKDPEKYVKKMEAEGQTPTEIPAK
jgi:YHS domain-containing protein